ncbi:ribonuclease H-like domain-containing protein [Xylariaceae sp. FL1272]|nr:ribonuclease H-like domain-containing protein [Xylariaceae sp. FL1272]
MAVILPSFSSFHIITPDKTRNEGTTTLDDIVAQSQGLIGTIEAMALLIDEIHNLPVDPPSLYLDIEGVNLGPYEAISVVQVHVRTTGRTYLIDVHTLGESAFLSPGRHTPSTLTSILESDSIQKVFFDVRNNSAALHYNYGIQLQCIDDLQLMDCSIQRKSKVRSLATCITKDLDLSPSETLDTKQAKECDRDLFLPSRPFPDDIRAYGVKDVDYMPMLWDKYNVLIPTDWRDKLKLATEARITESQSEDFHEKWRNESYMSSSPPGWALMTPWEAQNVTMWYMILGHKGFVDKWGTGPLDELKNGLVKDIKELEDQEAERFEEIDGLEKELAWLEMEL